MTNELAIQEMLTVASHLKQTSQGEAVMMGAVALEKQLPKKPNRTARPYVCPICAKPIVVEANELPNHCYQCGQRLEWEDND